MFENATSLQIQPGMLDEAMLTLRAFVVPVLRGQPGLLGLALVPCKEKSLVSIISTWNSRACARAVEAVPAYRKEIARLDHLIVDKAFYRSQAGSRQNAGLGEPSQN